MTRNKLPGKLIACLLTAFSVTAIADDTEIFVDRSIARGLPNVLFILDTSGSMMTETITLSYDPQTDYATELANDGGTGICQNDRLYFQHVSYEAPHCGTQFLPFSNEGTTPTSAYIDKDENIFNCAAAWTALDMDNPDPAPGPNSNPDSSGFYSDEWTAYDPSAYWGNHWTTVDSVGFRNLFGYDYDHVECRTDQGLVPGLAVHGPGPPGAGTPPYVSEQSPPYDNAADPNFVWGTTFATAQYVFYTGNYLNFLNYAVNHSPPGSVATRMEIVKDVMSSLLHSIQPINVGVMAFDYNRDPMNNEGGGDVLYPVTSLVPANPPNPPCEPADPRQELIDIICGGDCDDEMLGLQAAGDTPLAETLHEAYLYWSGQTMKYGNSGQQTSNQCSRDPPPSPTSTVYHSPLSSDCTANYQIVLTDGLPNRDEESDMDIGTLVRAADNNDTWLSEPSIASDSCMSDGDAVSFTDSCLDDLAEYMNKVDISSHLSIHHTVKTYVVGFQLAGQGSREVRELFDNTATHGGGEFIEVSNQPAIQLTNAFRDIVSQVLRKSSSFTSPAISVNALNRLVHTDQLYFALFEPGFADHWPGNIKRYKLAFVEKDTNYDGNIDPGEGEFEIQDAKGDPAVNTQSGQFLDDATSWWRLPNFQPDGNEVTEGGLAHRLFDWDTSTLSHDAGTRSGQVFTFVADYPLSAFDPRSPKLLIALRENHAALNVSQESDPYRPIHRRHFGVPQSLPPADFTELIQWSRGVDTEDIDGDGNVTEGRPQFGSPLHTRPQIVTYAVDPVTEEQDNVVFSMTNNGYFHASRASQSSPTGRLEEFAFIPKQLLANMDQLRQNANSQLLYGLDGGLTVWRHDVDKDGNIEPVDGDHVYAYFGMRRGGRSYFALDVTDLSSPRLLWVINPDNPQQAADPHFKYLGQSWAEPQLARVYVDDGSDLEERNVIILSGGYSPIDHDTPGSPRDAAGDNQGHALYIIDAETAEVLWWASKTNPLDPQTIKFESDDMLWSFPAHPRAIDIDIDGIADMLIAADAGGQVWRFDIKNQVPSGNSRKLKDRITGGVIADLQKKNSGHTLTTADNRRFYYTPDAAIVSIDDDPYLAIAVGSGYRAKPLDEDTEERFYLIKDYSVRGPPTSGNPPQITYTKLYEDDLLDVTTINLADSGTSLSPGQEAQLENGWFLKLDEGEKVLARSITVSGSVIFTTYTPPANLVDPNSCTANAGVGAAYVVRIDDARPVFDFTTQNDDLTLEDRRKGLKQSGIPSQPLVVYTELPGGQIQAVALVGKEILTDDITNSSVTGNNLTFWYEQTP